MRTLSRTSPGTIRGKPPSRRGLSPCGTIRAHSHASRARGSMGPARRDAGAFSMRLERGPPSDPSATPKATNAGLVKAGVRLDQPRGPPLAEVPSQAVSDRSSDPADYKNHMAVAMPGSVARANCRKRSPQESREEL